MSFRIESSSLILRPYTMNDLKDYFRMVQEKSIRKYTPGAYMDSISEAELCFKQSFTVCDFKNDFYLAIVEKDSNKLIGGICTTRTLYQSYECCYFIEKESRGKGYMKEALQAFLENFPTTAILYFEIKNDNIASLSVVKQIPNIIEDLTFPDTQRYVYIVE